MKRISLLFVLVLALSAIASANIIPSLISGSPTGTGPFTWTYDFQLSGDQNALVGAAPSLGTTGTVVSNTFAGLGAFVTVYDFAGYNGTCGGPLGWTCTAQATGYTPTLVNPTDNAGLVNITWTHTSGADVIGGGLGSSTDLGNFTAQSIYGVPVLGMYASRAVKNTSGAAGTIGSNVGNLTVPNVPEPATMGLIGIGLVGLGLLRRRVRKS